MARYFLVMLLTLASLGTVDGPSPGGGRPQASHDDAPSPRAFVYLKRVRGEQGKSFPTIVITPDPALPNPDLEHLINSDPVDLHCFALPKAKFATLWRFLKARLGGQEVAVEEVYEWGLCDGESLPFRLGRPKTLVLLKRVRAIIDLPGSPLDNRIALLIVRLSH